MPSTEMQCHATATSTREWAAKQIARREFRWRSLLDWWSERPVLSLGLIVVLTLLTCCVAAAIDGIRPPSVHDEFSYMLAGEMFASGHVARPAHPMWPYLETFHTLQQPVYASKYPPGQGLFLALGILLGHPIIGVWLSLALACAAICWMLQACVPSRWALCGGFLAVTQLGFFNYWAQWYWGGAVAALGGALYCGAVIRLMRRPTRTAALLAVAGFVILVNTRPYEGVVFSILVFLAAFAVSRNFRRLLFAPSFLLPILGLLLASAAGMMYYNQSITGRPFLLPYSVHESQYAVSSAFIFMPSRRPPSYRHPVMEKFWTADVNRDLVPFTIKGFLHATQAKLETLTKFYLGYFLAVPFVLGLFAVSRHRRSGYALLAMLSLFIAALSLDKFFFAHYAAPAAGVILLVIVLGLRRIARWRYGRHAIGSAIALLLILGPLFRATGTAVAHLTFAKEQHVNLCWQRQALEREMIARGGRHLIIVRYQPDHLPNKEWVFNHADIDSTPVVWVREMKPDNHQDLRQYFLGRQFWLLEPDAEPPRLTRLDRN